MYPVLAPYVFQPVLLPLPFIMLPIWTSMALVHGLHGTPVYKETLLEELDLEELDSSSGNTSRSKKGVGVKRPRPDKC